MTYFSYPESYLQSITAPAFDFGELNWTIPLSFNFTFPAKESATHITYTSAVATFSAVTCYPPEDSFTRVQSNPDITDNSVLSYSPLTHDYYPLACEVNDALTSNLTPVIPPCGTSNKQPSYADLSDKCLVAQSLRDQKKWEELKDYISETCFTVSDHSFLQNFFYEAVYEIYKIERGLKRLTPPQRYRLRKTNPLPSTICSTKFKSNNHLDDNARSQLESVFKKYRFPTPEIVQNLVENTGLSAKQVKNYFKNNRSRK